MEKQAKPTRRMSVRAAIHQEETAIQQSDNTVLPQHDNTIISQSNNTEKQLSDNIALQQNSIITKRQYSNKTQERDKVTYYLDPGQLDKLDELRTAYRKRTGQRLSEQDFMRLIVTKLELDILL
jgi:hypothetical protein